MHSSKISLKPPRGQWVNSLAHDQGNCNASAMELYRIMYMDLSRKLFMLSQEFCFGVRFLSCEAVREIYTKIKLVWVHKQFVMKIHTILYFSHDKKNPQIMIKWWSLRVNLMSHLFGLFRLTTSQSITDDIRNTLCDVTIVTWAPEKWYVTHWISVLFTVSHVRNYSIRSPADSPYKGTVMWKISPYHNIFMGNV